MLRFSASSIRPVLVQLRMFFYPYDVTSRKCRRDDYDFAPNRRDLHLNTANLLLSTITNYNTLSQMQVRRSQAHAAFRLIGLRSAWHGALYCLLCEWFKTMIPVPSMDGRLSPRAPSRGQHTWQCPPPDCTTLSDQSRLMVRAVSSPTRRGRGSCSPCAPPYHNYVKTLVEHLLLCPPKPNL